MIHINKRVWWCFGHQGGRECEHISTCKLMPCCEVVNELCPTIKPVWRSAIDKKKNMHLFLLQSIAHYFAVCFRNLFSRYAFNHKQDARHLVYFLSFALIYRVSQKSLYPSLNDNYWLLENKFQISKTSWGTATFYLSNEF